MIIERPLILSKGLPGVLHGNRTYLLQDSDGQITEGHSISAGLDYPGIGPEHSWLNDLGRVNYVSSTDDEALNAFEICSKYEGIIPALEPSHALAYVFKLAKKIILLLEKSMRQLLEMREKVNISAEQCKSFLILLMK